MNTSNPNGLLQRVVKSERKTIPFFLDGQPTQALEGDTVLTAILTQQAQLRTHEFSHASCGGFCLMGACQDCWVTVGNGERIRACSTFLQADMQIYTQHKGQAA